MRAHDEAGTYHEVGQEHYGRDEFFHLDHKDSTNRWGSNLVPPKGGFEIQRHEDTETQREGEKEMLNKKCGLNRPSSYHVFLHVPTFILSILSLCLSVF